MRLIAASVALVMSAACLLFAAAFVILVAWHASAARTWNELLDRFDDVEPWRWVVAGSALVIGLALLSAGLALLSKRNPPV